MDVLIKLAIVGLFLTFAVNYLRFLARVARRILCLKK